MSPENSAFMITIRSVNPRVRRFLESGLPMRFLIERGLASAGIFANASLTEKSDLSETGQEKLATLIEIQTGRGS